MTLNPHTISHLHIKYTTMVYLLTDGIIGGQLLFFGTGQHGEDTDGDALRSHGGHPAGTCTHSPLSSFGEHDNKTQNVGYDKDFFIYCT